MKTMKKKYKNNNNYYNIKSILDKTYIHTYVHPNKHKYSNVL